jgi:hypothetical protein
MKDRLTAVPPRNTIKIDENTEFDCMHCGESCGLSELCNSCWEEISTPDPKATASPLEIVFEDDSGEK